MGQSWCFSPPKPPRPYPNLIHQANSLCLGHMPHADSLNGGTVSDGSVFVTEDACSSRTTASGASEVSPGDAGDVAREQRLLQRWDAQGSHGANVSCGTLVAVGWGLLALEVTVAGEETPVEGVFEELEIKWVGVSLKEMMRVIDPALRTFCEENVRICQDHSVIDAM